MQKTGRDTTSGEESNMELQKEPQTCMKPLHREEHIHYAKLRRYNTVGGGWGGHKPYTPQKHL